MDSLSAIVVPTPSPDLSSRHVDALVVSCQLESRQSLVRCLESLGLDVVACSNRGQAEEVLERRLFDLVFCDEFLPDGAYFDLISSTARSRAPKVVVMTRNGDWDLYFEALKEGAFDVLRHHGYSTDLEMVVIRALREEHLRTMVAAGAH